MRKTELIVSGEVICPKTKASIVAHEHTNVEALLDQQNRTSSTITQSASTSKVGLGDGEDLSFCVEDGFYESATLYGKTLVNSIQEPSSKDVVLPYAFENGQHVTINDTKESGALGVELKGQTLVNVVDYDDLNLNNATRNGDYFTLKHGVDVNQSWVIPKKNDQYLYKPNTMYTIIVNITENTTGQRLGISNIYTCTSYVNGKNRFDNLLGESKLLVRTGSDVNVPANQSEVRQLTYFGIWDGSGDLTTHIKFNFMILEGDWTDKETPPYFEGMTSCKMPILHTTGKNLFNYSSHPITLEKLAYADGQQVYWTGYIGVKTYVPVKENTTYTYSNDINVGIHYGLVFYDGDKSVLSYINNFKTNNSFTSFTTPKGCKFIRFAMETQTIPQWIQLEEGTTATTYEPYKSSILSLPEEVVLRSLPNGVCDTFNTRTGVYTQRIKEKVLNGGNSESWVKSGSFTGTSCIRFQLLLSDAYVSKNTIISITNDKFPNYPNSSWQEDVEQVNIDIQKKMSLNILKTKLTSEDVSGVMTWLSQNPLTIQYELATPIITKINLSSTLKSWDSTTHIYSEIPENTLYPTLSHSNPTYPVILKPSTKYSIVANSYSNGHTNSPINFNLGGATATTTVGNRVTTITTPSTLSNELLTMSGRGNKLSHVMVIEGEVVGDEPYFEGICDCQSPILSNVGKNLFDINNHTENQWSFSNGYPYEQNTSYGDRLKILGDEIHFSTDGGTVNKGVGYYIPLCKNKDYTFRINKKNGNGNYCVKLFLIHSSEYPLKHAIKQHSKLGINNETITSSLETNFNSANYDMCAIYIGGGWESGTHTTRSYVFNNISLTESNQQVEPYKSNTTTFDQKDDKTIVLRSLPNGVCDTLNVETGEYVQRIGEVMFDGSENWDSHSNNSTYTSSKIFALKNNLGTNTEPNCDKFAATNGSIAMQDGLERIKHTATHTYINITNNRYGGGGSKDFKTWLSQNPVTVQYELATPIVSTIDVQGFPYAYTNGHVQLSSGHSGQSLTPKVEYVVQTNRAGAIQANQDRLLNHDKRLAMLEDLVLHQLIQLEYNRAKCTFLSQTRQIFEGGIQMYHTKYELLSEFIEKKLYRSLEEVFEMLDVYFMLGDITDGEYDALYEALMPSAEEIFEVEETFDHEDVEV